MHRMFALRPGVRSAAKGIVLVCAEPASCQGRGALCRLTNHFELLREWRNEVAQPRGDLTRMHDSEGSKGDLHDHSSLRGRRDVGDLRRRNGGDCSVNKPESMTSVPDSYSFRPG